MGSARPARAPVDLDAVRGNARALVAAAEGAELCAVVKANGYGHGAVEVARAALDGGATWLGVALVEEGVALRRAGIEAPVLVLSEPPPVAMGEVAAAGLTAVVYTAAGIEAASEAGRWAGQRVPVHLKVDTGMHRVGARPDDAVELGRLASSLDGVTLEGLLTHLAASEDPSADAATAAQLERFDAVVAALRAGGVAPPILHCANSGATLRHPHSRRDLVRCGISLYGYAPGPAAAATGIRLRPVMSLRADVTYVKRLRAGDRVSYGLTYECPTDTIVATVPLGYADGVPRRLSAAGGQVLVGGTRRPIAGTVTMDQLMVDCGPDAPVTVGDEVVLIGEQSGERITAEDWALWTGTISYEIVCGIGARVPRVYR